LCAALLIDKGADPIVRKNLIHDGRGDGVLVRDSGRGAPPRPRGCPPRGVREGVYSRDTGRDNSREGGGVPPETRERLGPGPLVT
jgi:hypothetical protein